MTLTFTCLNYAYTSAQQTIKRNVYYGFYDAIR